MAQKVNCLETAARLFVGVKELQRQRTRLMSNLEAQKNFNLMVTLAVTGNDLSTHYNIDLRDLRRNVVHFPL